VPSFHSARAAGSGSGPDDLWDLGHDDYNPTIERPSIAAATGLPRTLKTSREW